MINAIFRICDQSKTGNIGRQPPVQVKIKITATLMHNSTTFANRFASHERLLFDTSARQSIHLAGHAFGSSHLEALCR